MAYTKESLNELFSNVLTDLDISNEMFGKARAEYEGLGSWIQKETSYDISIYPQGSFALGTVVKPISGKDDYDLDLVCEFAQQYGLSAKQLKVDVVKPWLEKYRRIIKIENKRRCWHAEYDEVKNFHMDVIPAYKPQCSGIRITEHNENNDTYEYTGSNPQGYIDWFYGRCQIRWNALFEQYSKDNNLRFDEVEVQRLDRSKVKTPLQKSIQLLKRHRDIMFKDLSEQRRKEKPISIIITTIAAQLYNNEDNVADALNRFLNGAEQYINDHKKNGRFYIENPSFHGENFAEKWNDHPERANAFFAWLIQAKKDLSLDSTENYDSAGIRRRINEALGNAPKNREVLNESSYRYDNTEQFIEDLFPVDIHYNLKLECIVSQAGFRDKLLSVILREHSLLKRDKNLDFYIEKTDCTNYDHIYWKIRNVGSEAERRNCIRGQVIKTDKTKRHETTNFKGGHYVECYLIKNNVCVARGRIEVPIE